MSTAPRFTIDSALLSDGTARVRGAELHHMRDVMRLREGAKVSLVDQAGLEYSGEIEQLEAYEARIKLIGEPKVRESLPIVLAVAIIKGPRMDFLVEKAAELWARALQPLLSERCVAGDGGEPRLARWRRIAAAAAKQSFAPPMEIKPPSSFAIAIAKLGHDGFGVICRPGAPAFSEVIEQAGSRPIAIACGPEGDFTDRELELAGKVGFRAAGLGPNRLRSETAVIAALSIAVCKLSEERGT